MDYIIKKALELSNEEKSSLGILGIPENWPIEIHLYTGVVPEKFEQISEENLTILKSNNQELYDAWAQTLNQGFPLLENYKIEEFSYQGLLASVQWYQDKSQSGVYSGLSKMRTYTYISGTINIKQIDSVTYNSLGETIKHEVTKFYTDTVTNKVITETEYI